MRSKWHTLTVAASLGIFASWNTSIADDNSSGARPAAIANGPPARNSAGGSSATNDAASRRLAQELLRQAMVELDGNRFETARRLARRAAAVGVTAGFAGVHPEQVLAEIDRKERGAAVVVPAASAESGSRYKARAIALLDHGLLALEERRFEDAERFAEQAAELHVAWEKYDYRPENLLEEIHRQSHTFADPRGARAPAAPVSDVRPTATVSPDQPAEGANRMSTMAQAESSRPTEPVAQAAGQQPVAPAETANAGRSAAETLLEQAMDDLRAGRDESARRRLEQAMGAIPGSPQGAAMASFSSDAAVNSNRPVGLSPIGKPLATPGSPAAQFYFPIRRDQPNMVQTFPAPVDVALKPMHDPYLGDEPTTTDKSSAGAQSMRESVPMAAAINPAYLTRSNVPSMDQRPVQNTSYDSSVGQQVPFAGAPPRVQTTPDAPALSPQIGWLEKSSMPIPGQGGPPAGYSAAPAQRGFNPAPVAPPVSPDGQWSAGRMAAPPGTDPAVANSPDQPKPNLFHKIWDAISAD